MSATKSKSKKNVPVSEMEPKAMLTHLESNNSVSSLDEYDRIMEKLRAYHRETCIKTLLEKKRVESVAKDLVKIQSKNVEVKKELDQVKGEYDASSLKLQKLQNLSQQLSSRMKETDAKSADEIRKEKENRLNMSNAFQQSIKDISVKLEELARRRETLITENVRLKTLLKTYLEEFEKYKELFPVATEEEEAEGEAGAKVEELPEESESDGSGDEADISDVGANVGESAPTLSLEDAVATFVQASASEETNSEGQNGDLTIVNLCAAPPKVEELPPVVTEEEELIAKLTQLQGIETALRAQSVVYMETFESFQSKLSGSNIAFQQKQNSIDKLTKEIKMLDKDTKQYASKLGSLDASIKSFQGGNDSLLKEKDKFTKANDKYQTLIATFQKDIEEMEAKLAA